MKKYEKVMSELMKIQYSGVECNCMTSGTLDEEFLCDLCVTRLRIQRKKNNRKQRINQDKGHIKS